MRSFLPKITDYPTFLNEAWQQHLAPRMVTAPTVISTFAGCGGSSLGYSMAGYRELLAVEWDNNAVQTFKVNFPEIPVYHGDIAKLSIDECMKKAGLTEPGQLDVLDGSPPCQGFSTSGKREFTDNRNQLFREYVRLLRGLKPKVLIMENVSGIIKGKMKLIFAEIIRELKACGYIVSARLLNAKWFGVPQSRERLIFIGVRQDLDIIPSFPIAKNTTISVKEAIGHLPVGISGKHSPQVISAWNESKPGQSLCKVCHYVGSFQSIRLDPNKPSYTQIKSHLNWHYEVARQVTILEAGIIGSFPDKFHWVKGKDICKNQIGNSVPPLFMREIALHIKNTILPNQFSELLRI